MPDWRAEIGRRLAALKLEAAREAEITEELAEHLEDRFRELVSGGAAEDQAFRAVVAELSDEGLLAQGLRGMEREAPEKAIVVGSGGGRNFLSSLWQDVRYGVRQLRRNPGFAAFVILTLALGIGATTATFTVVDRVLLEPPPYPHPNRIVLMLQRNGPDSFPVISIPMYMMWRRETRIIADATAQGDVAPVNLLKGAHPEQLQAVRVSENYFALFGYAVAMGRTFTAAEDVPGGPPVAVISHGLWQRRFGSDPGIVGERIDLDNASYTVIGVLAPRPETAAGTVDVYLPLQPDSNSADQGQDYYALGRLKPGVTVTQADAAMKLATGQFRRKYPNVLGPKESFAAESLRELFVSGVKKSLLILFGAVGFVLLIACANVANLLLVRETGRQREIAVRVALGASRGRIIRQILTEGVLLSLVGGAAGLLLGYVGVRGLLAISPSQLPWVGQHGEAVTLDWRVLLFALGISSLAGALAGLVPAVKASHTSLVTMIKESGSRAGGGMRHNKTRSLLVVVEMTLAMILLAGAGLLIRTFRDLRSVNPGFQTRNILTVDMSLAGARFRKTAAVAELVREGRQRLDDVPEVEIAAASCCLPLGPGYGLPFNIEGRAPTHGPYSGVGAWRSVSADYFRTFRIPLLRGHAFTANDSGSSQPVAIINEAMAMKFWPNGGELGTRIAIGKGLGPQYAEPPREIVGVVGDVRDNALNYNPIPTMYVPVAQVVDRTNALYNSLQPLTWVIRTRVAPLSLSQEVQKQLRLASGGLPVGHVRTMEQVVARSTERNSFNMTLLVIFAALALLLAAVGIYGVLAYSVEQRTQEIGIRMALGATPGRVRRTIAAQGMALALVGVAIGVGGGLALTRLMRSLLFGVKPWDPLAFVAATVVLVSAALLACYLPARRATKVDPMEALRCE